jgi:hypothetical protein
MYLTIEPQVRAEAVENFLDLLRRPKLPEILAQAMAWVLGEYGYLSTSLELPALMEVLVKLTSSSSGILCHMSY